MEIETLNAGDVITLLNGVTFDEKAAIFDDFVGGVDFDTWTIGNGAWGNGNGGVVPTNVGYTDEGVLVLRGNGKYYSGDDIKGVGTLKNGKNTGAALISKFKVGPGRYETKMKVLPRLGACTAFWTYSNRASETGVNDNHEIDIELPGGKTSGVINFKNVLNTNYITENYNNSQDINVSEAFGSEASINLNDGEFHTFGFDWYTNPGMVVYFIDGRVTAVSEIFTPTLQSRVWLGNWFPNNPGFVGDSLFETDYMYVDWFKYLPFDASQNFELYEAIASVEGAAESEYPTSSIAIPEVNKVSNGDFEYIRKNTQEGYGWNFSRLSNEEQEIKDVCYAKSGIGHDSSCGALIKDGGYLSSNVDSVYEGFKFHFSFYGKGISEGGQVKLNFVGSTSNQAIETATNKIPVGDWTLFEGDVVAPKDAYGIRIEAYGKNGCEFVIDDVKLEIK